MANPLVFHQQEANHASSSFNAAYLNNGNPIPEASSSGMLHNPGISLDWTGEEQAILVDGLKRFASEPSIACYAKIALNLPNKTVRDVAFRCRWMATKENSKRRKEEHNLPRKSKDKRERLALPSAKPTHCAAQPNLSSNALPMIPMDYDDECTAIGGATAELLQLNKKAFKQIIGNLSASQIQENNVLLCQIHANILKLMNNMNNMPLPDTMRKMPGIEVRVNDELAKAILPLPSHPTQFNHDPASITIPPPPFHPMQCHQDPASNPSSLLVGFP